jgi:hypothetical protein
VLVGHFAVALVGKRVAPGLSLGTLAFAALLAAAYLVLRRRALADPIQHPMAYHRRKQDPCRNSGEVRAGPVELVVEGGLWICAIVIYVRATRAAGRAGIYAFWAGVAVLTLAWLGNISAPPVNPGTAASALPSLVFFAAAIGWGYWMNRVRTSDALPPQELVAAV